MATCTIDGVEIFYQARGDAGPAVLFVHGAGGSWRHWGLTLRELEGACRVALDLPGHGRSGGRGETTIGAYSDVVLTFAREMGLRDLVLVGHSMGGAIAQQAALAAPDLVARLVLVSTGARLRVHPDFLAGLAQPDIAPITRRLAREMYGPAAPAAQIAQAARELAATRPEVYHGDLVACDHFDLRPRLQEITQPTLVLVGSEDRMTPPRLSEALAASLPNATMTVVPAIGHMPPIEAPDAVAAALRHFLELRHD